MKLLLSLLLLLGICLSADAQSAPMETIKLSAPELQRGLPVMQALQKRQSVRECSPKELSLQDMSNLLWAANGINRPDSGKRTAPSAMNKQDVKVYACTEKGAYLYDHKTHTLVPLAAGDFRQGNAPLCLVLVTDTDDIWAALDAGIVSQNISIFCSGMGLSTYARGTMDKMILKKALKLEGTQRLMLCHPVGYSK